MHLKAMSQLSQNIPRGITGGDSNLLKEVAENQTFKPEEQSSSFLSATPSTPFALGSLLTPSPRLSSINPATGLGIPDEQQYASMLATMTGDLFADSSIRIGMKRSARDDGDPGDEHPSKRSRFETIE